MLPRLGFLKAAGDVNLGLHACAGSMLHTKPMSTAPGHFSLAESEKHLLYIYYTNTLLAQAYTQ